MAHDTGISSEALKNQNIDSNLPNPEEKLFYYGEHYDVYPVLEIIAQDEPNAGGGHCHYEIFEAATKKPLAELKFQNGPIKQGDLANGIIDEALLSILIHRQRGFQNGPFASTHGSMALQHLVSALRAKEARKQERKERGVLGQHKP